MDGGSKIVILARGQPRAVLDDHHFAAQSPESLRHLHADVTAAKDHQPARKNFELESLDVGERHRLGQAGKIGNGSTGAEIEVDPRARQPPHAGF